MRLRNWKLEDMVLLERYYLVFFIVSLTLYRVIQKEYNNFENLFLFLKTPTEPWEINLFKKYLLWKRKFKDNALPRSHLQKKLIEFHYLRLRHRLWGTVYNPTPLLPTFWIQLIMLLSFREGYRVRICHTLTITWLFTTV